VIVKPRRRSRAQPAALAAAVERVAGLPAGTLDAPPTHRRGVRLVQRVDRDTADRLAEGAEVAGY
jgi:hypothetical protein